MGGVQLDRQAPILVTGSAGRIGRAAVSALVSNGWRARGFDCRPTPGTNDFAVADLVDAKAVQQAASGATAIIHLAGVPDDDDFLTRLNSRQQTRQMGLRGMNGDCFQGSSLAK